MKRSERSPRAILTKKNEKADPGLRRIRKLVPFDLKPVLHPDKIEIRICRTAADLLVPEGFAEIRSILQKKLEVRWQRPAEVTPGSRWTWSAWNNDFRITFVGTTAHLDYKPGWISKAFPTRSDLSCRLHRWSYIGSIRLTSRTHDPVLYLKYISKFFEVFELVGLPEVPREIEIALDIANSPEGLRLARCVRLKRDNPLDLAHFRRGYGNTVFRGPSPDGMNEYSNFTTYTGRDFLASSSTRAKTGNGGRLQLKIYDSREVRPGTNHIRIELTIGPRKLREFMRSPTYKHLQESAACPRLERPYPIQVASSTLNLLSLAEFLFLQNVVVQDLNAEKLRTMNPGLRNQTLSPYSVRGKRYKAVSSGLTLADLSTCTIRGQFPGTKVLLPDQCKAQEYDSHHSLIKGSIPVQQPSQNNSLTCSYTTFPDNTEKPNFSEITNEQSDTYNPETRHSAENIIFPVEQNKVQKINNTTETSCSSVRDVLISKQNLDNPKTLE